MSAQKNPSSLTLAGHAALITGGARGLGQAYAQELARRGADVGVVDVDDASATVELIEAEGRRGAGEVGDITDPEAVKQVVETISSRIGIPDILINNAGIFPFQPFPEIGFENWRKVMAVNLDAVFLMSQACLPAMRDKSWGRIVNVTSNTAWTVNANFAHYIASKMGVVGLTRALASEYGADGVTVNCVAPSLTPTPGTRAGPSAELFETYPSKQAIPRIETPEDLALVVAFLVSDDARFITGQTIAVDGGLIRL